MSLWLEERLHECLEFVRSLWDRFGEYAFTHKKRIKGDLTVGYCYQVYWLFEWLPIAVYLMLNGWHLNVSNKKESTSSLKIRWSVNTSYSAIDFDKNYVQRHEHSLYNRQWDDVDFFWISRRDSSNDECSDYSKSDTISMSWKSIYRPLF